MGCPARQWAGVLWLSERVFGWFRPWRYFGWLRLETRPAIIYRYRWLLAKTNEGLQYAWTIKQKKETKWYESQFDQHTFEKHLFWPFFLKKTTLEWVFVPSHVPYTVYTPHTLRVAAQEPMANCEAPWCLSWLDCLGYSRNKKGMDGTSKSLIVAGW